MATQTGASIGLPAKLPARRVKALHGVTDVETALRLLLDGSGYTARQTGPRAWKIVPVSAKAAAPPRPLAAVFPAPPAEPDRPAPDIIVTATKTGDVIRTLPLSAHIVSSADLARAGPVPTTAAIAMLQDGLVLSNLGPGRNKAFLRGISDSPFNGVTQSTVAIEIEDARVTFNAPDPDLRLVDIERVELLEGPQGPMHGTGALGGVYRIVPRSARTDVREATSAVGVEAVAHGGVGASASAMANLPLEQDRVGLRLVVYGAAEPGWIEREGGGGHDSNATRLSGGRATLRWTPDAQWTVDVSGIIQMLHVRDSQYVDAAQPAFERRGALAEPHDNDFMNGRLVVNGRLGGADLISTTSWTSHEVDSVLDASAAADLFGQTGPLLFDDRRQYDVRSQEVRLSGGHGLRWIGGLSYLRAQTQLDATVSPLQGADVPVGRLRQKNAEMAAFGQLSVPLWPSVRLDMGTRLFRTVTEDEVASGTAPVRRSTRRTNFSPSASLGWTLSGTGFVYARFASAYRPAGLSPFAPPGQEDFESDELQSAELGGRFRSSDDRLHLNATAYFANWSHIQSDYLLPNGLVATRNSGTGRVYGLETDMSWSNGSLQLGSGLNLQHARLETPEPGLLLPGDPSLPIVPSVKAHLSAGVSGALGRGSYRLASQLSYVGPTRLSLDPALNRRIDGRTMLDLGASYALGNWSLGVRIDNVLNARQDSFGYGNPFTIRTTRQITPQKPRLISLTVTTSW